MSVGTILLIVPILLLVGVVPLFMGRLGGGVDQGRLGAFLLQYEGGMHRDGPEAAPALGSRPLQSDACSSAN